MVFVLELFSGILIPLTSTFIFINNVPQGNLKNIFLNAEFSLLLEIYIHEKLDNLEKLNGIKPLA